jgi:aspartyl-tRNA(Asn)/glutamyl-tRNA(Gln) amidotransferase subunit A
LGTDTGGSIRQPAAFCGVVGFKPTYGSVSRYGLVAFASSLDQVGAFGYTVDDVALVMEAISGKDACDATSADQPPIRAAQRDGLKDVRVGIPREYFGEGLDASVEARIRESIDALRDLGATIVDVSLPHARYYVPTYYLIATAEASSNLARYEGVHYGHRSQRDVRDSSLSPIVRLYALTRGEAFGAEVKRRIMLGTYALSAGYKEAYYGKALKVRGLIRQDFVNAFEQVDCIATPTAPTEAFAIGEKSEDPLAMYLSDIYTLGVSLAGLPGVSLPCGLGARGLPVGLQLIGRHFHDGDLLGIAAAWQASTRFHLARPEAFV